MLLCSSLCFAKTFEGGESLVETFFNKGNYIKIVKNEDNIYYCPKSAIVSIRIDEDDICFVAYGYSLYTGKMNDTFTFNINKNSVELDEDSNIIIIKNN